MSEIGLAKLSFFLLYFSYNGMFRCMNFLE
ncbi:hypothetical protein RLON56S_00080 [Alishewanella longhuensis]